MMRILAFALILTTGGTFALADKPVSQADAEKIQAALKAWGCSGGKMEQETEGSAIYEVDDANGMDRPCSRPQRHAESVGGF